MIIMGVDLGSVRTGIAVSDNGESFAFPRCVITERNQEALIDKILDEARASGAKRLVVGLPKNMDGSIGFQAQYCLDFKAMLEKEIKLPVIMIDERMTSKMAHNTMLRADMSRNKRKQNVDKLAATIILQSYLDSLPRY